MTVSESVKAILPAGLFMTDDHRYYFNGEGPNPSVTTVLDVMSKPALITWKAQQTAKAIMDNWPTVTDLMANQGWDAATNWALRKADEQRDTAAKLGSSVHLLADMVSRASEGDSKGFEVSEQERPYLDAFSDFLGRYGASSIVSSEKAVWSLNGYGGTYDLLMQIPCGSCEACQEQLACEDPELWLIDIKTSKGYYPEYGLQLAAYRWADYIILPNDPTPYPMPSIQRTGVLHLRPDQYPKTGWRLVEYPTDYQKDYIPFLGALELYKWKAEGRFTKSRLQKLETPSTNASGL